MESEAIIQEYLAFLNEKAFPCVGAKAALAKQHIQCMVADHMACPKDDSAILQFLYDFVDEYRNSDEIFHRARQIVIAELQKCTLDYFAALGVPIPEYSGKI